VLVYFKFLCLSYTCPHHILYCSTIIYLHSVYFIFFYYFIIILLIICHLFLRVLYLSATTTIIQNPPTFTPYTGETNTTLEQRLASQLDRDAADSQQPSTSYSTAAITTPPSQRQQSPDEQQLQQYARHVQFVESQQQVHLNPHDDPRPTVIIRPGNRLKMINIRTERYEMPANFPAHPSAMYASFVDDPVVQQMSQHFYQPGPKTAFHVYDTMSDAMSNAQKSYSENFSMRERMNLTKTKLAQRFKIAFDTTRLLNKYYRHEGVRQSYYAAKKLRNAHYDIARHLPKGALPQVLHLMATKYQMKRQQALLYKQHKAEKVALYKVLTDMGHVVLQDSDTEFRQRRPDRLAEYEEQQRDFRHQFQVRMHLFIFYFFTYF
jgi:hypothetical protein